MTGFLLTVQNVNQFTLTGAGGSGINEVKNVVKKLKARASPLGAGGSSGSWGTASGCGVSLSYKEQRTGIKDYSSPLHMYIMLALLIL